MIERYSRAEMSNIFSLENKYRIWTEIEVSACEAQAELGQIGVSSEEAAWIRKHADFDVDHIDELEATLNHDVIAFLTDLGEHIDAGIEPGKPKPSRWVHYGMTSSDLGDTALCCQLTTASDLILASITHLGEACKELAFKHRDTLCVGRTHGIHAEPMTLGMKFGSWAWALKRAHQRMAEARLAIATGAISGAVGSYSNIDPFVESFVCSVWGLNPI
ncbi:MAG: adenylosuccinate lyase, partial [Coriobacteriales bacterium]|nr:adenylosuccinate lyase [Coriobacteriales bacterium]